MSSSLRAKLLQLIGLKEALENEDSPRLTPQYKARYDKALDLLIEISTQLQSMNLWSSNETLEDLSTGDLWFLNVDFYTARLLDLAQLDPAKIPIVGRINMVQAALRKYLDYLITIHSLDGLVTGGKKLDSMLPDGPHGKVDLDPIIREMRISEVDRAAKIEAYRKLKLARSRYEAVLEAKRKSKQVDEELEREVTLEDISYNSTMAWDAIKDNIRELEVLYKVIPEELQSSVKGLNSTSNGGLPAKFFRAQLNYNAPPFPSTDSRGNGMQQPSANAEDLTLHDVRVRQEEDEQDRSTKVDVLHSQGVLDASGKVQRPFTLLPRDQIARRVQGTGQQLPTMTVEELVDKELANGGMAKPGPELPDIDEDDPKHWDAETAKQRRWDDFTEANPRGSGNTMNLG